MMSIVHSRMSLMIPCLLLAIVVGSSCSGPKIVTKSSGELSRYKIRSIAMMPFTAIATPQAPDQDEFFFSTPSSLRRSDISIAVPSFAKPQPKQTMMVPGYAEQKVTELFWGRLQDWKGIQVLSPGDSARALSADGTPAETRPEQVAAAVAKRLKVDATFIGRVLVYQERVGS